VEAQSAADRELAGWLLAQRQQIESIMTERLGPAVPAASSPESEALRRFRSFSAAALRNGQAPNPSLEGLRVNERRVRALLEAWTEAAAEAAGTHAQRVRRSLAPLKDRFRLSLRTTPERRTKSGKPKASRRAVIAAIDRVADVFLAIDTDDARIADANPAAGALLGIERDALIDVDGMSFVPESERASWQTQLDSVAEGDEPRRFRTQLMDKRGEVIAVEVNATGFATRGRSLALVLARRVD
jgi:PAS domain S-box-containing protein